LILYKVYKSEKLAVPWTELMDSFLHYWIIHCARMPIS